MNAVAKWRCPGCGSLFQAGNASSLRILVCPCGHRTEPNPQTARHLRLVDPPARKEQS